MRVVEQADDAFDIVMCKAHDHSPTRWRRRVNAQRGSIWKSLNTAAPIQSDHGAAPVSLPEAMVARSRVVSWYACGFLWAQVLRVSRRAASAQNAFFTE
jgi:hypothetical protein